MSTSNVEFTPIYGGSTDGPICYLLQIDGYNILLDCGWDDSFDLELIQVLKE